MDYSIQEILSFTFMQRALIVGIPIALCAALLGVSLILKRYSMIGDGLSHVGFGALSLAAALNLAPLKVSIPIVIISAFLLLRISRSSKINGDGAIAIVSSSALAIGIVVTSMTGGLNTDLYSYLFGSILALSHNDVILSVILCAVVLFIYVFFYHKIFTVTFDENFSIATGTNANAYNMVLALLTALTVVLGMQIMGTLLISSLIIFPGLTAMRVFKSYRSVVVWSAVQSIICVTTGLILSFYLETASGATIVCVNLIFFIIFSLIGAIKKR
ncbi:MAG: metal ABC transporter permease [Clostridia bacterium]|nr:metal ABC transporter permease [Clostridia bacterium]